MASQIPKHQMMSSKWRLFTCVYVAPFGMGMQSRQRDTYARYWKMPLMLHNHHSRSVTQTMAHERLHTSRILLFKTTFFLRLKPLLLNGNTKKKKTSDQQPKTHHW